MYNTHITADIYKEAGVIPRKAMKNIIYVVVFSLFLGACSWKDKWIKKRVEENESSKKAYFMGYALGKNATQIFKEEKDQKIFLLGVYHSVKGKDPLLNMEDINKAQNNRPQPAKKPKEGNNNMEQGKNFLEENSNQAGVKVTASGLQYEVLKEGSGKSPTAEDKVEVHYRGTLINGKEFDSSYSRNQTVTFPLNGVIKGWTEGLQLMKEGAKYKFYIPSELAYGSAGTPGIPPDSVLIFEVELIKVNP